MQAERGSLTRMKADSIAHKYHYIQRWRASEIKDNRLHTSSQCCPASSLRRLNGGHRQRQIAADLLLRALFLARVRDRVGVLQLRGGALEVWIPAPSIRLSPRNQSQ